MDAPTLPEPPQFNPPPAGQSTDFKPSHPKTMLTPPPPSHPLGLRLTIPLIAITAMILIIPFYQMATKFAGSQPYQPTIRVTNDAPPDSRPISPTVSPTQGAALLVPLTQALTWQTQSAASVPQAVTFSSDSTVTQDLDGTLYRAQTTVHDPSVLDAFRSTQTELLSTFASQNGFTSQATLNGWQVTVEKSQTPTHDTQGWVKVDAGTAQALIFTLQTPEYNSPTPPETRTAVFEVFLSSPTSFLTPTQRAL